MDADFSIELGTKIRCWIFLGTDPAGKLAYVDLKRHPELLATIEEAKKFPELGEFLRTINSSRSALEMAKCDVWETTELNAEEEIYNAAHKFASYVDVLFTEDDARPTLPAHEQFARKLVELLHRAPETPSAAEVCVRQCYYGADDGIREGFFFTLYVSGYGNDSAGARQNWAVGLKLTGNAIVQLSAGQ